MAEAWREHDKRIWPYVLRHRLIAWSGLAFSVFLLVVGYRSGFFWAWQSLVARRFVYDFTAFGVFFLGVGAFWKLALFPFDYASYRTERHYGLSKQSVLAWLKDQFKAAIVGGCLAVILLSVLFLCIDNFPFRWWVVFYFIFMAFSVLLAQLAPILLIPLFYELKPLEEGVLKKRLLELCKKHRILVKDIYHLGMGEKTEKGNAAFVGLGKTKRILIGDTLYEKFSPEEVEAVFAHELGHQVHQDIWKGIGVSAVLLFISFFGAYHLCESYLFTVLRTSELEPMGVLTFLVTLFALQIPLGVLQTIFSRSMERSADRFALEKIGLGKPLADALEKLTYQNFGLFSPNPILEFLTHSHPAPSRRIRFLTA